jgi:hypothetical protein
MSVLTFKLTEKHIIVLRKIGININFFEDKVSFLSQNNDETVEPDIYEELDLILYGKTEDSSEFDDDVIQRYGPLKVAEFETMLRELPTALDIILYTGKFEPGIYKTKYHVRDWKKTKQDKL